VLDASVAAKWVLPAGDEPLRAESVGLLEAFTAGELGLSVPDLFWPEVGNILWKSARIGRISEATVWDAIDWLLDLKIPTSPTAPLLSDAARIAVTFDRTVYDSIYVALAIASNRPLITADERLVNAVGAQLPVRWLGSMLP